MMYCLLKLKGTRARKCAGCKTDFEQTEYVVRRKETYTFYNKNVEEEWTKCGFRYYHASRACVKRNNKLFNGQVIVEGAEMEDRDKKMLSNNGIYVD